MSLKMCVIALGPFPDLSSSAPLERFVCLPSAQNGNGGGLYIEGTATLTNTNVYENVATWVHLHFEPS